MSSPLLAAWLCLVSDDKKIQIISADKQLIHLRCECVHVEHIYIKIGSNVTFCDILAAEPLL